MNNLSVALKLRKLENGPKTLNMIGSPRWISDGRRSVQYGKWKIMATQVKCLPKPMLVPSQHDRIVLIVAG